MLILAQTGRFFVFTKYNGMQQSILYPNDTEFVQYIL